MDPNSSYGSVFSGYSVATGELGAPTKPDTANQIQQVNSLLNQGIVPIEVGALTPDVFDQIPRQHFKEIKRMAELTGAKISVHAPIIEPSGIGQEGWSEGSRELAERQFIDVMEKSHEIDPKGNIPITIHSANMQGSEYKMTADGKKIQKLAVINQEEGRVMALQPEVQYMPGGKIVEEVETPQERLENINRTQWRNSLRDVEFARESAERIMQDIHPNMVEHYVQAMKGELPEELSQNPDLHHQLQRIHSANEYLKQAQLSLNNAFNNAVKYAKNDKVKEALGQISQGYGEALGLNKKESFDRFKPQIQSRAIFEMTQVLENHPEFQPDIYVPVENFALKESSKTFANVALAAYDKYKKNAPTISIENLYPGMPFALKKEGKDGLPGMNELIVESKRNFVEGATKSQKEGGLGLSRGEAEKQADKIIGMTFDVGHLNIARKSGLDEEALAKETAAIAKHVKHVHLTDNFGYSDSHLPPGMGNVPIKEMLEELEKAGTLEGTRKVVEAGGWVQHFQSSPLPHTLAGMGAPITTEPTTPYWNQTEQLYQSYSSGFGLMLPHINYQTFGAGFSQLPSELGGQMGGGGSRMGGAPLE